MLICNCDRIIITILFVCSFQITHTSTQTMAINAPETNCTCPVPSSYVSVCQTPNHAPRVVEQSLQPSYSIQLPNDQVQMLEDFVPKGSIFVRIAGLSGVSAVAMGAYGAHSKYNAIRIKRHFPFRVYIIVRK